MTDLFLALLIINSLIMTMSVRRLTEYNWFHCIFLGVLTGGPLMIMGVVKVLAFMAMGLMEIALLLGGLSTKELLQEFVDKFDGKNRPGK